MRLYLLEFRLSNPLRCVRCQGIEVRFFRASQGQAGRLGKCTYRHRQVSRHDNRQEPKTEARVSSHTWKLSHEMLARKRLRETRGSITRSLAGPRIRIRTWG